MKRIVLALIPLALLTGRLDPLSAEIILVTSEAALAPNDSVDWGQIGPGGPYVISNGIGISGHFVNSFHLTSNTGIPVNDTSLPFCGSIKVTGGTEIFLQEPIFFSLYSPSAMTSC